jgi:type I restriction enzyme S subunit
MKQGWEIKKLGDLCQIKTGKKDVNQGNPNGKYPFFTCAREHTFSDSFSFDTEALLIAGNGDVGNVSYFNGKFEAYQRTYVLSNFVTILPKFLFLILDGKLKSSMSNQKLGNTMPYIKLGMLTDFEIPLPPISEQQRIVAILDEALDAIAKAKSNAEQNLKNAKELFDCVLDNFLYDKKWEVKELGEVCIKVEYGSSTKSTSGGKLPVLRMGNIQNRRFTWDSLMYSDNDEDNKQYLLKHNDVLFNRTNSPELVGKTAIYKSEMPAIFAGYLIRIHRKEDLLDADYLNFYLNSKMANDYGKTVVISSVNQANINGTKLKTYPIPLPTLKEQKSIVEKLDALSAETKKLETIYQQKINDLEELKKSVLQKAFAGELKTEQSRRDGKIIERILNE